MKPWNTACAVSALGLSAIACDLQQNYVLTRPLEVKLRVDPDRVTDRRTSVTLPPGTRVRQVGFKEDVAFIEVQGTTSLKAIRAASE